MRSGQEFAILTFIMTLLVNFKPPLGDYGRSGPLSFTRNFKYFISDNDVALWYVSNKRTFNCFILAVIEIYSAALMFISSLTHLS